MQEWIRNHKGLLTIGAIGVLFSLSMGGKVLTRALAGGASQYDARLVANQAAVLYMACYALSVAILWGLSKLLDRVLAPRS